MSKKTDLLKLGNEEANRLAKRYFRCALILLIKEIGYEKITVTNLCKKANLSRTAFYNNYDSKEDLVDDILTDFLSKIIKSIKNPFYGCDKEWFIKFFYGVKNNYRHVKNIIESGFHGMFVDKINNLICKEFNHLSVYEKIAWNGALQNIIRYWTLNGMVESPEYLSDSIFKFMIIKGENLC